MDGFWQRIVFAFRCWFSILFRGIIPQDIAEKLVKIPQAPATTASAKSSNEFETSAASSRSPLKPAERPAPESFDRAVQMLALLQRDGRLIDFLAEDISPYPDAQLGAAVRQIHETCRQVLDRYVKLEAVLNSEEDQPVTVQAGFDASAIKLIGNVTGEPPLRGVLRHKGWRVKEANLPPLPHGAGRSIVAPAEVELP